MMRAEIRIIDPERSGFLAETLRPELTEELNRSTVKVVLKDSELTIHITAEDVVALRASMNSYLRWMKLALDTEVAIGGE